MNKEEKECILLVEANQYQMALASLILGAIPLVLKIISIGSIVGLTR